MIRLRHGLERGRAHPILGPLLVIVIVLLLAMVFLHVAHEGMDAATALGEICLGLASALGLVLPYGSPSSAGTKRSSGRGTAARPKRRSDLSVDSSREPRFLSSSRFGVDGPRAQGAHRPFP